MITIENLHCSTIKSKSKNKNSSCERSTRIAWSNVSSDN